MSRELVAIDIDHSQVERKVQALRDIKDGAPRAILRAMNRTLQGMGTDAGRESSQRYIIKQKNVRAHLNLKDRATLNDLSISMRSTGRPIRLAKFKTKPNKRPGQKGSPTAFAQVKRDTAGNRIRGAFMADFRAGKDGHTGIFVRTGKFAKVRRGPYKGTVRESIRQLHGPGVVQMLDNPKVRELIQNNALKRFDKELEHQVEHLLSTRR